MDLVIDANILFSALNRQDTTFRLMLHEEVRLFAPEFLLIELAKYKNLILQKMGKSSQDFEDALAILNRHIRFIPIDEFLVFLNAAEQISPDPKDTAYLALALKMGIPVWTNDRQLRTEQDRVRILSTKEVIEYLT